MSKRLFSEMCNSQVVSGVLWYVKSSIVAKYSFIWRFVSPLISVGRLIARWPETESLVLALLLRQRTERKYYNQM